MTNLNGKVDRCGNIIDTKNLTVWDILKDSKTFSIERIEYKSGEVDKVKWWLHINAYIGRNMFKTLAKSPLIGNYANGVKAFQIFNEAVANKVANGLGVKI